MSSASREGNRVVLHETQSRVYFCFLRWNEERERKAGKQQGWKFGGRITGAAKSWLELRGIIFPPTIPHVRKKKLFVSFRENQTRSQVCLHFFFWCCEAKLGQYAQIQKPKHESISSRDLQNLKGASWALRSTVLIYQIMCGLQVNLGNTLKNLEKA